MISLMLKYFLHVSLIPVVHLELSIHSQFIKELQNLKLFILRTHILTRIFGKANSLSKLFCEYNSFRENLRPTPYPRRSSFSEGPYIRVPGRD